MPLLLSWVPGLSRRAPSAPKKCARYKLSSVTGMPAFPRYAPFCCAYFSTMRFAKAGFVARNPRISLVVFPTASGSPRAIARKVASINCPVPCAVDNGFLPVPSAAMMRSATESGAVGCSLTASAAACLGSTPYWTILPDASTFGRGIFFPNTQSKPVGPFFGSPNVRISGRPDSDCNNTASDCDISRRPDEGSMPRKTSSDASINSPPR